MITTFKFRLVRGNSTKTPLNLSESASRTLWELTVDGKATLSVGHMSLNGSLTGYGHATEPDCILVAMKIAQEYGHVAADMVKFGSTPKLIKITSNTCRTPIFFGAAVIPVKI